MDDVQREASMLSRGSEMFSNIDDENEEKPVKCTLFPAVHVYTCYCSI